MSFYIYILTSLSGNRDVKTPSYPGNIRFSPCERSDAFLNTIRAGHKAA